MHRAQRQVIGYVLAREHTSIPGLVDVARLLPRTLAPPRHPAPARPIVARDRALVPRMRIAILGTRGIPANYGGFETFAQELSTRLVARGHDVSVYCRPHYVPRARRPSRACSSCTCRRCATNISTRSSTRCSRRRTRPFAAATTSCWCATRPTRFSALAAAGGHAGRAQRRRHRAHEEEMERARARLVFDVRTAATWLPDAIVTDARRHQDVLPPSATMPSRPSSRTAARGTNGGRATLDRLRARARRLCALCQPPRARKQRPGGDRGIRTNPARP